MGQQAARPLSLGVFEMMNPSNVMPTHRHSHGRSRFYADPRYWIDLARTLQAAGFDFLFFADTYGYPTIGADMPEETIRNGIQFPGFDPMLLISALSQAAPEMGYVVTSTTTVEKPYATARRFGSLDQYTHGNIGWNIVTGSSQQTTDRLFGITESLTHDGRYDSGDEFVDVCLALWEGGWEDDAVCSDPSSGDVADPTKVHRVVVEGRHYSTNGYFAIPPTPQRTPTLFQAGTSERGRAFAARNAEAVFIQGQSVDVAARQIADIRAKAADFGRDPAEVRVISGITVIVGETRESAYAKRAELEELFTLGDAAVIFAGFTGIDLRNFDADVPLSEVSSEQGRSQLDRFLRPGQQAPTPREILEAFRVKALRGFQVTGTPRECADAMVAIAEGSGLDGFMLEPTFGDAQVFEEFIEHVLPILRERGCVHPVGSRPPGLTLRERLGLPGPRLADTHPGARFRRAFV